MLTVDSSGALVAPGSFFNEECVMAGKETKKAYVATSNFFRKGELVQIGDDLKDLSIGETHLLSRKISLAGSDDAKAAKAAQKALAKVSDS